MRKMKIRGRLLLAAIFVAPGASLLCAQNVPPPPKPLPDGPSLEQTLESLKQTLLSSAGLTYTITFPEGGGYSKTTSVIAVRAEPEDCRLRIDESQVWSNQPSPGIAGVVYDLEKIDTVEAMTLQESWDRPVGRRPAKLSDGYIIIMNDVHFSLLWPEIRNKDAAMRAAELLRRASEICRAKPVRLNAVGGPSLSDTLLFIRQKLNDEAAAYYEQQWQSGVSRVSQRVADVKADSKSCQISYMYDADVDSGPPHGKAPIADWNIHVSFRRVRKLEVVGEQEYWERLSAQGGGTQPAITPNVYRLEITDDSGVPSPVYFRDAEMADRVAKAMNHAAELCGSNKSKETKEPF
jgi:hypothetical protein